MAGFFSETQAVLAAGGTVYCPRFVFFDAVSGPLRTWEGFGPILMDGHSWSGAGQLGGISDVPIDDNDSAGSVIFTVSGVAPVVVATIRAGKEMRGRDVVIYGRFFDVATLQPLDSTFVIRTLVGDVMSYGASGPASRTIQLTAESRWTGRNLASYATYSDKDQQERFAGDLGCEFVSSMKHKVVSWPVF